MANREPFAKLFLANIHRYTENVFGICTDFSWFVKFFLANSFYLFGSPKFLPCQIFPVYGTLKVWQGRNHNLLDYTTWSMEIVSTVVPCTVPNFHYYQLTLLPVVLSWGQMSLPWWGSCEPSMMWAVSSPTNHIAWSVDSLIQSPETVGIVINDYNIVIHSTCPHTHVHMHNYIHAYTHAHIWYMHACTHTHVYTYDIYVSMHAHTHPHIHTIHFSIWN